MAEKRKSPDEKHKEYFSRVNFALTDCGRIVLLHLLEQRVVELTPKAHPTQPWSLDEFLYENRNNNLLSTCRDKQKSNILYPGFSKKTDLDKWDIPLLVSVLLNACKLDDGNNLHSQLRHDIINLKNLRNKMDHKGTSTLSKELYKWYFGRILGAVTRICDYMQEQDFKESLLTELAKYGSLRHTYKNGLISEFDCKPVDIVNDADAAVVSGLQQLEKIIKKQGLSVKIPVLQVFIFFRNYNKEDEQSITEHLHRIFSEALENDTELPDDRTLNQLEVAVKSLLAKLFDEKKILTKVNKGCLILSIQCNDLDAVISLIEDSLSGKLGRFFEPLEELMRTDAGYKLFEVDVGITSQSCWALLTEMFYEVSDKCDQRCFTVESIVQDDGIAVRIQVFLQSIKEKENLQQSFSSVEKQEICKKIEELLAFDLDQPGMDMVLLPSIINEGTSRTPPKNLLEKKKTMMHEPLKHRVEAREKIRHSQVKNSSEDKKTHRIDISGEFSRPGKLNLVSLVQDASHISKKPKKTVRFGGAKKKKPMKQELLRDGIEPKGTRNHSLIKNKDNDKENGDHIPFNTNPKHPARFLPLKQEKLTFTSQKPPVYKEDGASIYISADNKKTPTPGLLQNRMPSTKKKRYSLINNNDEDLKRVVVRSEYELDSKKLKEGKTAIGSRQLMKNERRHWKTGYSKSSKYKDIGSRKQQKHTGVPILFMNHTQMKHEYMNTDDDQTVHSNSSKLDYTPTLPSKGNMQLVNRNGYEEYGSIDGMTVVNDMYLVAADNENMCLRCFHIDTWKQKYWYDCKLKLWDITTVPSNIVAVTTSSNEIWFLHVSGMGALDLKNEISVKQGCYGIASCGDNLIVSYKHPVPGIEILDQNGNVIKVFDKDNRVDELFQFQFPDYLAVSPDLKTIYISDRKKETLNVFNQEGRTLCVVKGNARYHSGNVTVDSAGRMYVCGQYVNTVNLVSPKTGTVTKLLGAKDGVRLPRCVAICESKRRMYVGMCKSKMIKIFESPM